MALTSVLVTTACGSSSGGTSPEGQKETKSPAEFPKEMLPSDLVQDLPLVAPKTDLEIPLFTGIVDIEPGDDVTFCTFTDYVVDEPTIFGETYGAQSPTGHHAILQYVTTPQEPHTGSCGQMDGPIMLGGTGGKSIADSPTLPTNYGVEVPAGAQLVINHHWINTMDHAVSGQSMVLARKLARGGDTVMAGSLPMLGLGWEVPAMGKLEYSTECTYSEDVKYVLALGHMHEWGEHVKIEVERAAGGTDTIIDEAWTPEAATTAGGGTIYGLDEPYVVNKGDTVRLTCKWENTTTEALGFPREMCIFFGYTIDANYFCANGTWLSADAAKASGMGQQIIDHL
jgi:hypothetical protein